MRREAVIGKQKLLHALIEMVEPTHQSHFVGRGFKSPNGAVVKSYGAERLGKGYPRDIQIWIVEMNESELLKRRRERLHPVKSCRGKHSVIETGDYLFIVRLAGGVQAA